MGWIAITASASGIISLVAAVVAAGSALVTVLYAQATVKEAQKGRRETAEQTAELLAEQRREIVRAEAAHQQQVAVAERAQVQRVLMERALQLDRIAALVLHISDIARQEVIEPPPKLSELSPFPLSRLPAARMRLATALVLYEHLGGTPLGGVDHLARGAYAPNLPPTDM